MSSSVSPPASAPATRHYGVLDGWRAVSIALVLCGHLLPLGPSRLRMNEAIAAAGMVLFFTLSGFLITSFLLRQDDVRVFLIRRFCRIVPLAWLFSVIVLAWAAASLPAWPARLLFYANLPPFWLIPATAHLWSRCLEVQFYVPSISSSYALYVIHGGLINSWLGSGETTVKYLKRPLLFAVLFALAHLSTFHFESRWIAFGQRLSRRVGPAKPTEACR